MGTTKIKGFIPRAHFLGPYFYGWVDMSPVPVAVVGDAVGWNEDGKPLVSTPNGLRIVPVYEAVLFDGDDRDTVKRLTDRAFHAALTEAEASR